MSAPLLVEIHTEELPPLALNNLAKSLANSLENQLIELGFTDKAVNTHWYASPRRIAVYLDSVNAVQKDQLEEKRGPSVKVAFDEAGQPTKALVGFLNSVSASVDDLERVETEKGEWLLLRRTVSGRSLDEVLNDYIDIAIKQLPVPKKMRWGNGDYEFVRPVHSILVVHGDRIITGSSLGCDYGNTTRGHRELCQKPYLEIAHAKDYVNTLEQEGFVYTNAEIRRTMVMEQVAALAESVKGTPYHPNMGWDEELVTLVTALVEYPQAIIGEIDQHYMELPRELLVTSMKDHQKYFPVFDNNGALLPYFITVANIKLSDPARVVAGNQRVLRARLDDAEFFWKTDAAKTLEERRGELDRVLYHNKVGTVGDRVNRMIEGLPWLLSNTEASEQEVSDAKRAIELMKSDLVSEVVGEFPELQGTVGRYYAERDGESPNVAQAIEEHYLPRFAGDALPQSTAGLLAAIAERMDGLVTLYAAGEAPSGTRDRYALRRQALGLIRLILATGWPIRISDMLNNWPNPNPLSGEQKEELKIFILERLRHELVQVEGYSDDIFNAVIAIENDSIVDIANRVKALSQFVENDKETATKLAQGLKRAGNFLSKSNIKVSNSEKARELLKEVQEQALQQAVDGTQSSIEVAIDNTDYLNALQTAAQLQEPIDAFFDGVLVLDEDPDLRNARLALLNDAVRLLTSVADISQLQS